LFVEELYALGITSALSSLFPVFPISASLSSTMVKVEAGSRTQLANVFAGALLAAIILYLGRFLKTLPMVFGICYFLFKF
jgi:MFS superfamily sulfate permease-like transporter